MSRFTNYLRNNRLIAVSIAVVVLGVVAGVIIGTGQTTESAKPQSRNMPRIANDTTAIQVVGSEVANVGNSAVLQLSFRNISTKNIKAYAIATGSNKWTTRNYFLTEQSIPPYGIEKHLIPLGAEVTSATVFSISAVVFEDGTADGKPKYVLRLTENYAGMRDQANRLLPCLEKLPASLRPQQESLITNCETEVSKLPTKGRSSDYEEGLKNAQLQFSDELTHLKNKLRNNSIESIALREKTIRVVKKLAGKWESN